MEYTEDQVLKAIYDSGLHQYAPGVIRTSWKDGIDIDLPHSSLMNFVRKLTGNRLSGSEEAAKANGCDVDDLNVCGNCDGTGFVA